MNQTRCILLSFALLSTSCADCADTEPPAKVEDICPAQPLPPQDCYVPSTKVMPGESLLNVRKVDDFKSICNSPCTKIGNVSIGLEEELDGPMPMGNVNYVEGMTLYSGTNRTLAGMNKLEYISYIGIMNTNLEYISDLESLNRLTQIEIRDNNRLVGATKPLLVEEMTIVGSQINISSNPKIKDLKLFSNLKRASYIVLQGNGDQSFDTLEGLNNLEEIESLVISGNRNLKSLRALSKLKKITNLLVIENHGKLPQCEIDWLLGNLDVVTDDVQISNNSSIAPDCAE